MMDCTQVLDDFSFEESPKIKTEKKKVATLEVPGGINYPIYNGENRIGRDPATCSVLFSSMALSKEHAVIQTTDSDNHLLYDLGSRNKTRLGKLVLQPYVRYQLLDKSKLLLADISAIYHKLQNDSSHEASLKSNESLTQDTDFIPETPLQSHKNQSSKRIHIIESPGEESIIENSQPCKQTLNRGQMIESRQQVTSPDQVVCKEENEDNMEFKDVGASCSKIMLQDIQIPSTSKDNRDIQIPSTSKDNRSVCDVSQSIYELETQREDFESRNVYETRDVSHDKCAASSKTTHKPVLNSVTEEDANPYIDKSMSENVLNTLLEETSLQGDADRTVSGQHTKIMKDMQSELEKTPAPIQKISSKENTNLSHNISKLSVKNTTQKPDKCKELQNTFDTPTVVYKPGEETASGDDTDPEDFFNVPTQTVIDNRLTDESKMKKPDKDVQDLLDAPTQMIVPPIHEKYLPVPETDKKLKIQGDTSDDDTDPEDFFNAPTQVIDHKPNTKQMSEASKSGKVGSVQKSVKSGELKNEKTLPPLNAVKNVDDSTDTVPEDLFNAPTQVNMDKSNTRQLPKASKLNKIGNVKSSELKNEKMLPPLNQGDITNEDTDPEDIFNAPTQVISDKLNTHQLPEASKLDKIGNAKSSELKNEKMLPPVVAVQGAINEDDSTDQDTDPEDMFNAPTQVISDKPNTRQLPKPSKLDKIGNIQTSAKSSELKNEKMLPPVVTDFIKLENISDEEEDIHDAPTQVIRDKTNNKGGISQDMYDAPTQVIVHKQKVPIPESDKTIKKQKSEEDSDTEDIFDAPTQKCCSNQSYGVSESNRTKLVPKQVIVSQQSEKIPHDGGSGDDTDAEDIFDALTQKIDSSKSNKSDNVKKSNKGIGLKNQEKSSSLPKIDENIKRQESSDDTGADEIFNLPTQKIDTVQSKHVSNITSKGYIESSKLSVDNVSKHISDTSAMSDTVVRPASKHGIVEIKASVSQKDVQDTHIQQKEAESDKSANVLGKDSNDYVVDLLNLELPSTQELIKASKEVNALGSKKYIEDVNTEEEDEEEDKFRNDFTSPVIHGRVRGHLKRKATSARSSYIEKKFGECVTGDIVKVAGIDLGIQPLNIQHTKKDNPQKCLPESNLQVPQQTTRKYTSRTNKASKDSKAEPVSKDTQNTATTKDDRITNTSVGRDEQKSCNEQQNKEIAKSIKERNKTTVTINKGEAEDECGGTRRLFRQRKMTWKVLENSPATNKFPPETENKIKQREKVENNEDLRNDAKKKLRIGVHSLPSITSDVEEENKGSNSDGRRKSESDLEDNATISLAKENRLVLKLERVHVDMKKDSTKEIQDVIAETEVSDKSNTAEVVKDGRKRVVTEVGTDVRKTSPRFSKAVDKDPKKTRHITEANINKDVRKISHGTVDNYDPKNTRTRPGKAITGVDARKSPVVRNKGVTLVDAADAYTKKASTRLRVVEIDKDTKNVSSNQDGSISEVEVDKDVKKTSVRYSKAVTFSDKDDDAKRTSTRLSKVRTEVKRDVKKTRRQAEVNTDLNVTSTSATDRTTQTKAMVKEVAASPVKDVKRTSTRLGKVGTEVEKDVKKTTQPKAISIAMVKEVAASPVNEIVQRVSTRQHNIKKSPTRQFKTVKDVKVDENVKRTPTRQSNTVTQVDLEDYLTRSSKRHCKPTEDCIDSKKTSAKQSDILLDVNLINNPRKVSKKRSKSIPDIELDVVVKKRRHSRVDVDNVAKTVKDRVATGGDEDLSGKAVGSPEHVTSKSLISAMYSSDLKEGKVVITKLVGKSFLDVGKSTDVKEKRQSPRKRIISEEEILPYKTRRAETGESVSRTKEVATPARRNFTKEDSTADKVSSRTKEVATPARRNYTKEKDSTEDKATTTRVSSRESRMPGRLMDESFEVHSITPQRRKMSLESRSDPAKKQCSDGKSIIAVNVRKIGKRAATRYSGGETPSQSSDNSESPKRLSKRMNSKLQYQVLFTGFEDAKQYEAIVKKLGGVVVDSPDICSVLVTDKIRRTFKFLCIIGRGQPIVSPDWLTKSQKADCFLDPWKYVIKDHVSEAKFNFSLRHSLRSASKSPLLSGYSVMATSRVKPPVQEMKSIVESCGGNFLSRNPGGRWPENSFVISCTEDKSTWNKFKKVGIPVVGTEILLTGVLQHKLDLKAHSLS